MSLSTSHNLLWLVEPKSHCTWFTHGNCFIYIYIYMNRYIYIMWHPRFSLIWYCFRWSGRVPGQYIRRLCLSLCDVVGCCVVRRGVYGGVWCDVHITCVHPSNEQRSDSEKAEPLYSCFTHEQRSNWNTYKRTYLRTCCKRGMRAVLSHRITISKSKLHTVQTIPEQRSNWVPCPTESQYQKANYILCNPFLSSARIGYVHTHACMHAVYVFSEFDDTHAWAELELDHTTEIAGAYVPSVYPVMLLFASPSISLYALLYFYHKRPY